VAVEVAHYGYFNAPRSAPRAADVPEMAEWYRGRSLHVRLSPFEGTEDVLRALSAAGLVQTGFMSVLCGDAKADRAALPVVEDGGVYARLWTADPAIQPLIRAEFSRGWRCFVAVLDGQPAAYGALYVAANKIGVCAAAATLPAYRNRGCQTALLRHRIAVARAAGCTHVVMQAQPGSTSERNMKRLGLQMAYTSVVWTW
jgi:GNAT superfamily N-acetyltransferase